MAFNAMTYRANRYAKRAAEELAQARAIISARLSRGYRKVAK